MWGGCLSSRSERKLLSKRCSQKKDKDVQVTFTVNIDIYSKKKRNLEVQPQ